MNDCRPLAAGKLGYAAAGDATVVCTVLSLFPTFGLHSMIISLSLGQIDSLVPRCALMIPLLSTSYYLQA